ncbi:MAG: hypothetical protein ACP5UM_08165 [Anaerolineae bacterium]
MQRQPQRAGVVVGALLILLGILFFLAQFVQFEGWVFLLGLGIIFLAVGWLLRTYGFLIPGGILAGLGVGIAAGNVLPEDGGQGGAVLLGLGLGFILVWLLGWAILQEKHPWPLIPGGILGVLGALLLAGAWGLQVLELLGKFWPVILVVIGIVVLISAFRAPRQEKAPAAESAPAAPPGEGGERTPPAA